MDLIYPDTSFCEQSSRLLDSLNGANSPDSQMALEDELGQESSAQELLKLVQCIKNNSNESQVESCMSLLADGLDDEEIEVDSDALETEQAHCTVLSAMRDYKTNYNIQLHGCYVLSRLMELSPRARSELQEKHTQRFILQMMERFADKMCQVVGCKLLSALCTSARTRSDALDYEAVDAVLSAMSYFGEDEEFYIPAFEALTQLLSDDTSAQENFINMDTKSIRKKKFRVVIEIMEKHAKSGEIQEQGIQLMCVLASSNKNCCTLVRGRTFMVALEAMKKHHDSPGVQAAGSRLLLLLAAFEDHREILVQQSVVLVVILRALQNFKDCVDVQKNGLTVLAHLTEALENKIQDRLRHYSWTREVFAAMTSHCDKPEVLDAACNALRELIDFCPDVLDEIGDEPGDRTIPLHRCCMAALMLHIDDPELCQSACRVLASIVNNSSSLRESLISKGLYLYIVGAMRQHKRDAGVQQWGCRALRGLSLSGGGHKELMINCGVLELVFRCTHGFAKDIGVQEEAIALIACLATDVELVLHQSAVEGIHSMILNAMSEFPEQMSLAEISLEALGVLTAAEEIPDLLVSENSDHGGVKTIFNAMTKHEKEPAIQQKGCILVQVLAPLLSNELCQMAVSAIIQAMCRFPEDRGVQAEGCVAMLVIAQIDEGKSTILVNNCAHERLFFILETFIEEPELVFLASECIRYLGWERNLKTSMLLSACAGGLLKGADCLIKKGADVNAGQGENTPLFRACQNGKEEMVKFLLTQGVTDIHSALRISLEMGYNNIVGLLLQHLGHDKEAGTIAFKNLNLGDLLPEWMSPSLAGNKYSPPALDANWTEYLDDAARTIQLRANLNNRLRRRGSEATLSKPLVKRSESLDANFTSWQVDTSITSDTDLDTSSVILELESFNDSDSDSDVDLNGPELTEESPLRARSISGASFPYSSHDPRVVSPFSESNCVILPRSAHRRSVEEHLPECQRPMLKRRAVSDITRPFASLEAPSFSGKVSPRPGTEHEQVSAIAESEEDTPPGVFKMPDRSYVYSWEQPQSYRVRSMSACSEYDSDRLFNQSAEQPHNRSKSAKTYESFAARKRRKQSIRAISDKATVRLIDASSNGISNLQPLSEAPEHFLAYLAKVEKLDLSHNQLSNFPLSLCDAMPVLTHVNLSHNEFSSFPYCFIQTKVRVLNLSHNKINMFCPQQSVGSSVMLENLNLSHNEDSCFPECLGDLFPALTSLYVVGNNMKKLPDSSLNLKRLKTLDLSNNQLTEIPHEFISECFSLETLLASNNCLTTLPEAAAPSLTNLKTLRLNKNNLGEKSSKKQFSIPRFLLMLPSVKILDLSSNNLEDIPPPISWSTQQLKELILADNKIKKLSLEGVESWAHLERLNLSDNCLKQVPSRVGELRSLTSLNLSRNTGITHLPDEMGELSSLWDLQLIGLKLDLDSAILESRAQELIGFLHSRLKNSVPYYRMKLVAIGQAGRGKTTLLNQLQEDDASGPHHDVMIREWCVRDTKAECKMCHRKSVNYVINTFDLKGRDDLYSAYLCLLSSRTLFLAVYDVSKGTSEIDALKPWLLNIHACAPEASVMLVGTHKDKVPKDQVTERLEEIKVRALSMCAGAGFPQVKSHVVLDCTQETSGVKSLRHRIMQLITRCKCKGHSLVGPRVPQNFLHFQELIMRQVHTKGQEPPRILRMANIRKLIQDNEILMNDTDVEQAIRFLSEAGVLIHINDPACQLDDLVFVDPMWVFHLFAHLVTWKDSKNTSGILGLAKLEELIRNGSGVVEISPDLMPQIIKLLEHYCVVLPLMDGKYLLPSLLSNKQPSIKIPNPGRNVLVNRVYNMAYLPVSFWPRLITRVQTFVVNLYMEHRAQLESPREPQVQQWNEGIFVYWAEQAFVVISHGLTNPSADSVVITTPSTKHGARILAHVVDHLDTLLEEWYPDLCDVHPQEGLPLVKKQAVCPVCKGDDAHSFALDAIARASANEYVMCPNTKLLVSLRQIAPDVVMEDVGEQFRIDESKLVLNTNRTSLLGDGSYGAVYRASYNGKSVATKVFHGGSDYNPHTLLRQEVMFLRKLRHLSIITMVGACVKPWALVMELAPLGSLSTLLNGGQHAGGQALSRGIQHRIALQVAEGLAFLHHHMIVYRDLKPHNILIFSLNLANLVNAKLSDYGIARYATRCGLTATEGTPGYRAPEIARGDIAYNLEVDMYSFGMFLYELVTGGTKPFEDLRFRHELDAAVLKGQALDPITSSDCPPWPDMADLIAHALEPQPHRRVTAEQACSRLCDPELICLKRDIAVCKGQTVECMTVRHFTEKDTDKVEVWVGSGQSDNLSGQVSIIDLSDTGVEGCTGTLIPDRRVKSIVAVYSDTVLAGTQSGKIWVFDAWDHKRQFSLPQLPGAVLCLRHYQDDKGVDVVLAGLANGQLAVYDTNSVRANSSIKAEDVKPRFVDLCRTKTSEGTPCEDCRAHPLACTAVGKKRLFCGCGNDVVVLRIKDNVNIEIERRWSVEDRAKGLVLNIAVGSSSVWVSTRDSPVVECWDFAKTKFLGSVDCLTILRDSGYTGDLIREKRVVSLLLSHKTLWVGLGTGHVVLVDPSTRKPLTLLHRHVSAVRCLADTRMPNKSTSLVLTGGMGFIERHGCQWKKPNTGFGYTLVWEADFMEQAKGLDSHIRRRRELSNTLVE